MVFSLRAPSTPDPIQVALEKFVEKFTTSMKTWTDQFVANMKQASPKSEAERNHRVLICGYTQEDDCLCVVAESMESEFYENDEHGDAIMDFAEEEVNPCTRDVDQVGDEDDDNANPIVPEVGDRNVFQTEIEGPSPLIHQLPDPLIHDKVNSLLACDYSSLNFVENTVTLCTNKRELADECNMFDKIPKRREYTTALNPDPPDGFDQLTHGGTITQLDPEIIKLRAIVLLQKNKQELPACVLDFNMYSVEGRMLVSIIKNGPLSGIPMSYGIETCKVFNEMCMSVLIFSYAEEVCVRFMTDLYQLMYNDSGGGTRIPLYEGARSASTFESFSLEQLKINFSPPEVTEFYDQDIMDEKWGSAAICFVTFLPDVLDSKAEGRNKYLELLFSIAEKFKGSPCSNVWAAVGKQSELESTEFFFTQILTPYLPTETVNTQFTTFDLEPGSLDIYMCCLCGNVESEEILNVFDQLKYNGSCLSLLTWNTTILGSIQVGHTDIWKQIAEMRDCGVVIGVETVTFLIQAICISSSDLLWQALQNRYVTNIAFKLLVYGVYSEKNCCRVFEFNTGLSLLPVKFFYCFSLLNSFAARSWINLFHSSTFNFLGLVLENKETTDKLGFELEQRNCIDELAEYMLPFNTSYIDMSQVGIIAISRPDCYWNAFVYSIMYNVTKFVISKMSKVKKKIKCLLVRDQIENVDNLVATIQAGGTILLKFTPNGFDINELLGTFFVIISKALVFYIKEKEALKTCKLVFNAIYTPKSPCSSKKQMNVEQQLICYVIHVSHALIAVVNRVGNDVLKCFIMISWEAYLGVHIYLMEKGKKYTQGGFRFDGFVTSMKSTHHGLQVALIGNYKDDTVVQVAFFRGVGNEKVQDLLLMDVNFFSLVWRWLKLS